MAHHRLILLTTQTKIIRPILCIPIEIVKVSIKRIRYFILDMFDQIHLNRNTKFFRIFQLNSLTIDSIRVFLRNRKCKGNQKGNVKLLDDDKKEIDYENIRRYVLNIIKA